MKIEINVDELSMEQLDNNERELVEKAIKATNNSYAKYSHFHVGAAVRLENGMVIIGANQENAAFPVTLCAERAAIFAAQSNYPDQPIVQLAIAASNDNGLLEKPVTPCGSCRQVILEMEDRYQRNIEILLYGTSKVYRVSTVKDLLPLCFVDADMK